LIYRNTGATPQRHKRTIMLRFPTSPPPALPQHVDRSTSYVDQTLGANETVLAKAHFHPLQWMGACGLAIAVGWLLIPLIWIAPAIVRMATTEIAVTNHRLVLQNFMERLFGLGRLVVHGSGGGHWLTPSFAAPLAFRRAIEGATPGKRDEVVTP
jgi:hypothetical protein